MDAPVVQQLAVLTTAIESLTALVEQLAADNEALQRDLYVQARVAVETNTQLSDLTTTIGALRKLVESTHFGGGPKIVLCSHGAVN